MIDDLIGRPSYFFKKYQVLLVTAFWISALVKGPRHGPRIFNVSKISQIFTRRLSAWQIYVLSMTSYYVLKNLDKVFYLFPPPPLKDTYSRSFYRVTWVLTALDAGFWTAMNIKPAALRHVCSILFSFYYLIFAEQAESKVRKYNSILSVKLARISWNKLNNPFVRFIVWCATTKTKMREHFLIPRPEESKYLDPIECYMWYDGTPAELENETKILLDFHGGGFIAMTPEETEPNLAKWAKKFKIPVISINYKKAPEYPYPYALHECFDAYASIINSKGKCVGLSGMHIPEITLIGDSAGGNLCAGTTLKILTNFKYGVLPKPQGLILVYPALDLNYACALTVDQLQLVRQESIAEKKPELMNQKSDFIGQLANGIQSVTSLASLNQATRRSSLAAKSHGSNLCALKEQNSNTNLKTTSKSAPTPSEILHKTQRRALETPVLNSTLESKEQRDDSDSDGDEGIVLSPSQDRSRSMTPLNNRNSKDLSPMSSFPGTGTGTGTGHLPNGKRSGMSGSLHSGETTAVISPEASPDLHNDTPPVIVNSSDPDYPEEFERTEEHFTLSSKISYANDRILTPEMLRAVLLLYIGQEKAPDINKDYFFSPILAPIDLLRYFPKVCLICGEADPFVDDSMLFAAKLREAKKNFPIPEQAFVETSIIKGISHAFMQMEDFLPEGRMACRKIELWIQELMDIEMINGKPKPKTLPTQESTTSNKEGNSFKKLLKTLASEVKSTGLFSPIQPPRYFNDKYPDELPEKTKNWNEPGGNLSDIERKRYMRRLAREAMWKEMTFKASEDVISERNVHTVMGVTRQDHAVI